MITEKPTVEQMEKLWNTCARFIRKLEIDHAENIYQSDETWEKAPDLVFDVCEIVGYYDYPENE